MKEVKEPTQNKDAFSSFDNFGTIKKEPEGFGKGTPVAQEKTFESFGFGIEEKKEETPERKSVQDFSSFNTFETTTNTDTGGGFSGFGDFSSTAGTVGFETNTSTKSAFDTFNSWGNFGTETSDAKPKETSSFADFGSFGQTQTAVSKVEESGFGFDTFEGFVNTKPPERAKYNPDRTSVTSLSRAKTGEFGGEKNKEDNISDHTSVSAETHNFEMRYSITPNQSEPGTDFSFATTGQTNDVTFSPNEGDSPLEYNEAVDGSSNKYAERIFSELSSLETIDQNDYAALRNSWRKIVELFSKVISLSIVSSCRWKFLKESSRLIRL
mgnify:CR=1 FL=1